VDMVAVDMVAAMGAVSTSTVVAVAVAVILFTANPQ